MATGFTGIIFNPTLPRSLNLLRNTLTAALTTSRSEEATAAAVGFYCTVTEMRVLIKTLLRAEAPEFDREDHVDPVDGFARMENSIHVFVAALAELERAGVSQEITNMLMRNFEAESPVHGLAAACIALFLGVRLAAE
jgi:hypothetical protein